MSLALDIFDEIGPLCACSEPEYPYEVLQPLAEIPGSWAQTLCELFALDCAVYSNRYIQVCMLLAVHQVLSAADEKTWTIVTNTEFLSVTVKCVAS